MSGLVFRNTVGRVVVEPLKRVLAGGAESALQRNARSVSSMPKIAWGEVSNGEGIPATVIKLREGGV